MVDLYPMAAHKNLSPLLPSLLIDNPLYRNKTARILLFALGAGYFFSKVFSYTTSILAPVFHSDRDFANRYGRGTWALITEANCSIGQAFIVELASRGFNIILFGRKEDGLDEIVDELHDRFPSIQTRILLEDPLRAYEEGYGERIYEQVKHLDISILVNNAGQAVKGYFYQQPIDEIRSLILVNCVAPAVLTRVLLPKLKTRTAKSAVVFISSNTVSSPRPIQQVYTASKTYVEYLARGLAMEYPDIDIIALKPGKIKSLGVNDSKTNMQTITPTEFVKVGLRYLGRTNHTYGHWKHRLQSWISDMIPEPIKLRHFKNKFPSLKK